MDEEKPGLRGKPGPLADFRRKVVTLNVVTATGFLVALTMLFFVVCPKDSPSVAGPVAGGSSGKLQILEPRNARILEMAERIFFPPPGHYTAEYWKYQRDMHIFGAKANSIQFRDHAKPDMNCLEFGSSAGYYLEAMTCTAKMGVELNPFPRQEALDRNLTVVPYLDEVLDDWADLVFSSHVLEHVPCPLCELGRSRMKMKPGGLLVLWLPYNKVNVGCREIEPDHHLHTWSESLVANLARDAGFNIMEAKAVARVWPCVSESRLAQEGIDAFDKAAAAAGASQNTFEINLVARRPA